MTHGAGILLFAAIGGYWVLERASTHKTGDVKRVGKVLGWVIILVSMMGVLCSVWCAARSKMGSCLMPGKGGFCPYGQHSPMVPQSEK